MNDTKRHYLDGKWELCFTMPDGKAMKGTVNVPGNIEPELASLGLIDDYLPGDYEFATAEFCAVDDWTYTRYFDAPQGNPTWEKFLVFEGIDTLADIYLNGEHVLYCNNMHMVHRLDVTKLLRPGGNELRVVIRSSELWARKHPHDMFSTAREKVSYYDSQSYLRKARHQWGWDNAPRLITSGIIRSVYIEELAPERFDEVYLYTAKLTESSAVLGCSWIFSTDKKWLTGYNIRLSVLDDDKTIHSLCQTVDFTQGTLRFGIPLNKIKLWWPIGMGQAKMYTFRLEMLDESGRVCALKDTLYGIRTLKLLRTECMSVDESGKTGGEFVFVVNGEKVYIRGTNWKPLDPLASLADEKTRSGKALEEIKNLNCNMVRIWGGGIYEDEFFFEWCDKNGIMVWQDFMLACEVPACDIDEGTTGAEYAKLIAAEAKQIIRKQRNHPSLALWCGDNENDLCIRWTNLHSNILPSDSLITRKILRNAVLHHDPYRDYVDSSPFVTDEIHAEHRRIGRFSDYNQPEDHLYPATKDLPSALRESHSCFIGEVGPIRINAASPSERIYEREKARLERLWDSPIIYSTFAHQNDGYFTGWRNMCREMCIKYFGRDFSFGEWKDHTLAVNYICAEVFKEVIEYCRANRPEKTGVIWWSLMDMWPMAFNYSVIDCDFNRKLPYFWIRSSQEEIALMAVRNELGGEVTLHAANDTLNDAIIEYTVTAYGNDLASRVIASGVVKQSKNSSSLIQRIADNGETKPELWIITAKCSDKVSTNHFITGKTNFETMREWVKIIGEIGGYANEILELM